MVQEFSRIGRIHCPDPVYKTMTINRVIVQAYVVIARCEYRVLNLNEVITSATVGD